jgi:hypothetical protein
MKILLSFLLFIGSFVVNAQNGTKEQTIEFINSKLNETKNKLIYHSYGDTSKSKIISVDFRIDTGKMISYSTTVAMEIQDNVVVEGKFSFDPSKIKSLILVSEKPDKSGMGIFSVNFIGKNVVMEVNLGKNEKEIWNETGFMMNFVQKDDWSFKELEQAFIRLRDLYR